MANHDQSSLLSSLPRNGRRLLLFPFPFQGHINPMLQLANILHSTGFNITIIHTNFNSPNQSSYSHFTFRPIYDGLLQTKHSGSDINVIPTLLANCVEPFQDCLARTLSESAASNEPIACLITDAVLHFTQAAADSFKLPRIVLRTSSVSSFLVYAGLPILREKGYFDLVLQGSHSKEVVPEFPVLKFKDIPKIITSDSDTICNTISIFIESIKSSSGLIWNVFKELEEPALAKICQDFPIPSFPIGPFHKYFPASSSSLLAQDTSSISWLDSQAPNSVVYVSFGSVSHINESEFLEMAMGLADSMQPFLWVVREGSVRGSEWLECLPDGFMESLTGRGYIVKWAPQQAVLAHSATGVFWTHNGWNSTLESICEGVPMICSPEIVDQPINARYVTDVWKVGVELENGFERQEIKSAIRRILVDKEGKEIRERIRRSRENVELCVKQGGSSRESLESLSKRETIFDIHIYVNDMFKEHGPWLVGEDREEHRSAALLEYVSNLMEQKSPSS